MSALPIIITTAGLNALPNAQNTGVSNVVIASMGVSPTQIAATAATNAIPGEVKRIAGVSGQVVADDQIYISAADQTEDTYVVRTIGLYLDTGVLFAVYSQAAPLLEKAGPAMAVLEAAIKLSSPQADAIEFSGGGWLNPQASETVQGVLRLASEAEAKAGTNTTRAVTPKGLKGAIDVVVTWIDQEFDGIASALAGKAAAAHTHVMGDVTGLVAALNAKAAAAHTHVMGDITGLVDALNAKAASVHTHAMSSIDGLTNALAGKAAAAHTHAMADINGLAEALAGKAAAAHTHVMGEITGLAAALAGKAAAAHTHVMTEITGLVAALAAKAPILNPDFQGISWFGTNRPGKVNIQGADDRGGVVEIHGTNGRVGFIGYGDSPNGNPYMGTDGGRAWLFPVRPVFNGVSPWDPLNFNPATKVTVNNPDGNGHSIEYGWNGSRFVARVNGIVSQAQVHLGDGASAGETQGGVATDRFVTPAALWSFARNLGSPGYAVIPGTGLLLQWGISVGSIPEGETHAVLPVAFGGGCLIALANPRNPTRNINSDFYMQVVGHFADRIAFFANRANGSAGNVDGFEWIALGRVSGGTPDPAYSSGGSGGIGGGGGGGGGQVEV